jgi:hypothetical protein
MQQLPISYRLPFLERTHVKSFIVFNTNSTMHAMNLTISSNELGDIEYREELDYLE